ncbi:MAG: glycosyltransferase [Planctomycetota bacterium]|nr:MAG: glycosyltransferase [Planctomycetota bacterium]
MTTPQTSEAQGATGDTVEVSVVVPVYNEQDNVAPLADEIRAAMERTGRPWELIYVDDGSSDRTAEICEGLEGVRLVRHAHNLGQSAATVTGIRAARGETIVTLDGDGQNDPASIPELLAALETHDVAQGIRAKRRDTLWRRFGSRLAWLVRNLVVRDGIKDIGCSLRAFPRDVALWLPPFDGLHRLMPALFVFLGLRVRQVETNHRPRTAGVSKYGNLKRGARGLFDLLGLLWLKRRMISPRGRLR